MAFGDPPSVLWCFRASCLRVVDGDTLVLRLDLGFGQEWEGRVRLLGVDTHETHGTKSRDPQEKALGEAGAAFSRAWIAKRSGTWPLVAATHKTDNFGRYLAVVWAGDDRTCLNDQLVEAGHAREYWGPEPAHGERAWEELEFHAGS